MSELILKMRRIGVTEDEMSEEMPRAPASGHQKDLNKATKDHRRLKICKQT